MLCEMQSASSSILTRVSVSISNDDSHYTTIAIADPMIANHLTLVVDRSNSLTVDLLRKLL